MIRARVLWRSRPVQAVACWLAAQYIRLVWLSGRWTVENKDIPERLIAARQPFIACFWHSRLLMLALAWTFDERLSIVISRHRDGRFIAGTVRHLNIGTIVGSSSKGGGAALRNLLKILASGHFVGITPDGPRGPRMRASVGVVRAARLAGAVMMPLTYGCSRRRLLDSWDRFVLPLPFGRGVIRIGEPIAVAADADEPAIEAARRALEDRLNALTGEVDRRFGFDPVAPAGAPPADAPVVDGPAPPPRELRAAGGGR